MDLCQKTVALRHIPVPVQIQAGSPALHPCQILRKLVGIQKRSIPVGLQIDRLRFILHRQLQGEATFFTAGCFNPLSRQISRDIIALGKFRRAKHTLPSVASACRVTPSMPS